MIGDVHLGVASNESERALLAFLRALPGRARSLIIMGDLFDFWFAWRHVMPRTGFRVLAAIADLTESGVDVLWIGGNHDCWGGQELEDATGARYTLDPWRGEIGVFSTLLQHGDGLREVEDAPYRRLRTVLRNSMAIRAFGWLHPDFASRIALSSSDTSRHRRAGDEGRGLLAIGTAAINAPHGPRLVIHGHSHVPALQRAGRGWYANAGAWYIEQQFLRIDDARITRCVWTGSGEGDVINVVDYIAEETAAEHQEPVRSVGSHEAKR